MLEYLISQGAPINLINDSRKTPLDIALEKNREDLASVLYKYFAKQGEELKAEGK